MPDDLKCVAWWALMFLLIIAGVILGIMACADVPVRIKGLLASASCGSLAISYWSATKMEDALHRHLRRSFDA